MLRLLAGIALALGLSIGAAQAGQAAECPAVSQSLGALNKARAVLLALPTGDGTQTDVPAGGPAAISAMKARLGDFVTAYLRCHPRSPSLAADLMRLAVQNKADDGRYGSVVVFTAFRDGPGLLGVQAGFTIECGTDHMLMIFAPDGMGWRETMRVQSKPYDKVSGAYEFFTHGISGRGPDGWFLVEANILPWCSSTWSTIHYSVLRPSRDPLKPRVLFEGTDPVWWEAEDERLIMARDGFAVRFHAESIDGGRHNRVWLRHFRVAGDRVTRVPPLAESARDFAEEWIQSDWKTVAPWTARPALKDIQLRMHSIGGFSYVAVRACRGGRTQVQLATEDSREVPYYLVVEGKGDYRLVNAGQTADPHCTGPNQIKPL